MFLIDDFVPYLSKFNIRLRIDKLALVGSFDWITFPKLTVLEVSRLTTE